MHLFILAMNDSGSTFMQNMLSQCVNCVSFQHKNRPNGMEGQGVAYWKQKNKNLYPRDVDHAVVKVFSEKKHIWQGPKHFNWDKIKNVWNECWKQNSHFANADPKIFLEKTPYSIFSTKMYIEQFPDAKFVIMHRNPYAVCEGIKRTVKKYRRLDYSYERCAKHWVECTKQQIENINNLVPDRAIWLLYENLVTKPMEIEKQISNFIPALSDIDFRNKKVTCHSMDKVAPRPVINYNIRHMKNINEAGFAELNKIFEVNKNLLDFFGYTIRTKAP